VGKGALAPCPPFFESNAFALNGGHAAGRIRARPLCPPCAPALFIDLLPLCEKEQVEDRIADITTPDIVVPAGIS
jgi:hypothetical protein